MTNYEKGLELKNAGEFQMRTCWKCNPSHAHLKAVGGLFYCFDCGNWYMNGGFFTDPHHCEKEYKEMTPLKTVTYTLKTQ